MSFPIATKRRIFNYLNNPRLKAAGVSIPFTAHQRDEYLKCARNPEYFIKTYVKIVNVDAGIVPFDMWGFQKKIIQELHSNRFVICRMARQSGKTTTVGAYLLHQLIFKKNFKIAILANKGLLAREILDRIKKMYENLPMWLQQGVVLWNKGKIELETGSIMVAAATTASGVRGETYNIVFLDEFAHVEPNMAEEFFTSVYPVISSGTTTKIFIVSTPKGMNHFYKMWSNAERGISKYVPILVHWSEVPGRDEKWKAETIANTSEDQFQQEFEVSFLGSSQTLIGTRYITQMAPQSPVHSRDGLTIYKFPEPDHVYIMTVDTSKGKGIDRSAFSIIDVTQYPYDQVGRFMASDITPNLYPDIIYRIGRQYNDAWLLVENNDVGSVVANILHYDLEYENIVSLSTIKPEIGIMMDKKIKRIGCANFKDLVEDGNLIINDMETIEEISTFVRDKDTFNAEEGMHDDIVAGLVLFGWFSNHEMFHDITDKNLRAKLIEARLKALEEDMMPPFFFDDGIENDAVEKDLEGNEIFLGGSDIQYELPISRKGLVHY